mgnify:CR=1 FL=1
MNKCTDDVEFLNNLPVASVLHDILKAAESGPVVVGAPPGSGKTLLVPSAVHDGLKPGESLVLVQPRRFAARAIARQIARIRGCRLGDKVGYRVRFDSKVSHATTLCIQTTGVLLRQCVADPSLSSVGCVILDEFHERSLEMDLLIGLLKNLRETTRPDLRVLIMSATLNADAVAHYLGEATVITATDRSFPVELTYAQHVGSKVSPRNLPDLIHSLIPKALRDTQGHVLVFLPGVGEIFATANKIEELARRSGCRLEKLFGDLPPEQQDAVLLSDGSRKIILSTNIAETSVTISGVTAVLDSGLARQLYISSSTGLPELQTVSISQASAEQRAGRAGRTGPGKCWRLWNETEHARRPRFDLPEVVRADLTQAFLTLSVLQQENTFQWLQKPSDDARIRGLQVLEELGCLEKDSPAGRKSEPVTELGKEVSRLPIHPRLAILLIEGAKRGVLQEVAVAAALLTERDPFRAGGQSGRGPRDMIQSHVRSDIYEKVLLLQHFHATGNDVDVSGLPPLNHNAARSVLRSADQYFHLISQKCGPRAADPSRVLREVFLTAYPDRLCRIRKGSADRGTMVGGRGVRLDKKSSVRHEEFFLAIDIDDAGNEVTVRAASAVEPQWLTEGSDWRKHVSVHDDLLFNQLKKRVEERRLVSWHGLILEESPRAVGNESAATDLLFQEALRKPCEVLPAANSEAGGFMVRAKWLQQILRESKSVQAERLINIYLNDEMLVQQAKSRAKGLRSFEDIRTMNWQSVFDRYLGDDMVAEVNRLAPVKCMLQDGKKYRIEYAVGKQPEVSIRIQNLFGVTHVPPIVDGQVTLLLQLLGPNNRPQQRTTDLKSFWVNTYPGVKKELKRRYPKHAWPDDPTAVVLKKKQWGKHG